MNEQEHIKVYTGSAILVNRLRQILSNKGIHTLAKDTRESGRLAGFGSTGDSVELFVFESSKQEVMPIINKFKEEIY